MRVAELGGATLKTKSVFLESLEVAKVGKESLIKLLLCGTERETVVLISSSSQKKGFSMVSARLWLNCPAVVSAHTSPIDLWPQEP